MRFLNYSIALYLILCVQQIQGEETVSLQGRISADETPSDEVWIGVFAAPVKPKAEALSWSSVDSPEFELVVPDEDELQLVVLSQDFMPVVQTIHPRSTAKQFELQLKKGVTLTGTVLSTDKIPISDAVLTLERRDLPTVRIPDHLDFSWYSDANGLFKISGLIPSNRYVVAVGLPDSYVASESFAIEVSESDIHSKELRLSNAIFVLGHVEDPDQARVLAASVRAQSTAESRRGEFWRTTTTTDAEGEFRLGPFVRGVEMWLTATHEDWGISQRIRTKSGDHGVELVLKSLVHVFGTVTDESTGKLIDAFKLIAIAEEASHSFPHSGAKGEFSAMVDRNTIGLIVDSEDHTAYFKLDIELESVDEYDLGAIALERGRTLIGKVHDESSGQPIVGATLSLQDHEDDQLEADHFWSEVKRSYLDQTVHSITDDNGTYELAPLPIHSTHIKAFGFGYLRKEMKVDEAVTHLDIALTKDPRLNTRIKGRIVTDVGEPAQGTVVIQTESSSSSSSVRPDGTFDRVMTADDYDIYAITDQGRSDKVHVALTEGEIREVTLVVKSEGRLTGVIEGLSDGETASLEIVVASEKFDSPRHASGLGNGSFVVEGIGIGKFVLTAATNKKREQQKPFEVGEATGEASVELYFSGQSQLYGSLKFSDGSIPAGEVKAIAKRDGKTSGSGIIDDDGTYEIKGLDDGEYTIFVIEHKQVSFTSPDGGRSTRGISRPIDERDVVINGYTEVDIQLKPSDN